MRTVIISLLLLGLLFPIEPVSGQPTAGVVGSGSPASCTTAALQSVIDSGGLVTFNCGGAPHTIALTATLAVNQATSIDGGGLITLSGGGVRRILTVYGSAALTLSNLTLSNGYVNNSEGAAVYLATQGSLTASNVSFQNNTVQSSGEYHGGGAVSLAAGENWGTPLTRRMTIEDCTFVNNQAPNGGALSSGNSTEVIIRNSTFDGNIATRAGLFTGGGALYIKGHSSATVTGSSFLDNEGANGGAIHLLNATLNLIDSTVEDNHGYNTNTSNGGGGAIYIDGSRNGNEAITITQSRFRNNLAHVLGGAIFSWMHSGPGLIVRNSLFEGNRVEGAGGGGGSGGGIWHSSDEGAPLSVESSLFTANHSGSNGGGLWVNVPLTVDNSIFTANTAINPTISDTSNWQRGFGAAIIASDTAVITNSTIANNRAGFVGGGIAGNGTAQYSFVTITNSIVANNVGENVWGIQQNCTSIANNGGGNLQYPQKTTNNWNDYECFQNLPAQNPLLGSLAYNGGDYLSLMPASNSPARDAGVASACPAADMRGFLRTDGACDSGAIEVGALDPDTLAYRLFLPGALR